MQQGRPQRRFARGCTDSHAQRRGWPGQYRLAALRPLAEHATHRRHRFPTRACRPARREVSRYCGERGRPCPNGRYERVAGSAASGPSRCRPGCRHSSQGGAAAGRKHAICAIGPWKETRPPRIRRHEARRTHPRSGDAGGCTAFRHGRVHRGPAWLSRAAEAPHDPLGFLTRHLDPSQWPREPASPAAGSLADTRPSPRSNDDAMQ